MPRTASPSSGCFRMPGRSSNPGLLEWVPLSERRQGDPRSMRPTKYARHRVQRPPAGCRQRDPAPEGGRIAETAGVSDATGWCPIDPVTFESRCGPTSTCSATPHRRRDAESAFSANAQAKVCAAAVGGCWPGGAAEPKLITPATAWWRPITASRSPACTPGRTACSPMSKAPAASARSTHRPLTRGRPAGRAGSDHHGRGVRLSAGWAARRRRCTARPWRSARRTRSRPLADARATRRGPRDRGNRQGGLCLLCHSGPFPEERFQGTLAPTSRAPARAGRRSAAAADRRRRPAEPGQHHAPLPPDRRPERVGPAWRGKPVLTAEQIEDVVAFLDPAR